MSEIDIVTKIRRLSIGWLALTGLLCVYYMNNHTDMPLGWWCTLGFAAIAIGVITWRAKKPVREMEKGQVLNWDFKAAVPFLVFVWCLLGTLFILSGFWGYQQHRQWKNMGHETLPRP